MILSFFGGWFSSQYSFQSQKIGLIRSNLELHLNLGNTLRRGGIQDCLIVLDSLVLSETSDMVGAGKSSLNSREVETLRKVFAYCSAYGLFEGTNLTANGRDVREFFELKFPEFRDE